MFHGIIKKMEIMGGYGYERTDVWQDETDDTDLQLGVTGYFPVYHRRFLFFGAGMGMKLLGNTKPGVEPMEFHVYDGADIYSSLKAHMMTWEFASDFKETNHYYFAYDENLLPYIVQVHGDLPEEYLQIQSYLYDESGEAPEPAVFYGMSSHIEADIREYAMESYNEMWGEKLVTEDNFSDYFGEYYLDTTRKPASNASETISLIFFHTDFWPPWQGLCFWYGSLTAGGLR